MSAIARPRAGAWAALGLRDGRCPVGLVTSADAGTVTVRLKSWATGGLMAEEITVPLDDVLEIAEASDWHLGRDGERVYDDRHLGDFQTAWTEERADR